MRATKSLMLQPQPPPTSTEPFREVIHQYTDTLCTTQKQTNLTNSLIQDSTVLMNMTLQN